MTFHELKFESLHGVALRAEVHFMNGYGASVVIGPYTYGGSQGLYELAVLHGSVLCYDTPITSDVLGHLTRADVTKYLSQIEALEPKE